MELVGGISVLIFAIIFNIWYFSFYRNVDKRKKIENAKRYDVWLREQGFEGLSDEDILNGNIPSNKIPVKIGDKTFSSIEDEEYKEALQDELFKDKEKE